jgi:hypothetical protein
MAIIYSDTEPRRTGRPPIPYERWNATKHYLEHYTNLLFLSAIVARPKDPLEKRQALKELSICERKLEYWTRHPNFDRDEVVRGCLALKTQWKT